MNRRTGGFYGINEALFSSALAAMVFSTIAAQPLTIVGITGLISLFNYTIYDIIKMYDVSIYPQFMAWTAIWAAIWHWLVAIWNLCDYMRYVTDFSSEAFGMYVGIIYMSEFSGLFLLTIDAEDNIVKGVEELVSLFDSYGSVDGYLSCVIAILYFGTVYALEKIGRGTLAKPWARGILADYAYPVSLNNIITLSRFLIVFPDCYHLLGWIFTHSGHNQKIKYQCLTHYSLLLSHATSKLAY